MGVTTWKLYKKMGYSPVMAFIPFYNYFIILKESKRPKWWVALSYLPIVGPIMMSVFHVFLMKKFGKKLALDKVLTVILPFIYMATVNYSSSAEVVKEEEEEEKKKESFISSIIYAVVFATVIHTFVTQPFGIPTGSMERTLLVGDFLFVNKLNYGYRFPMRPVAIPFLQGTIGGSDNPKTATKSYVDDIKLPYFRLPGWEKVERNDIVVFNYPQDSAHVATDRKDPYVKRAVGIPGDVIEMKAGKLFVNNKPEVILGDEEQQHAYILETSSEVDFNELFKRMGFISVSIIPTDTQYFAENQEKYNLSPQNSIYRLDITEERMNELRQLPNFVSAHQEIEDKGKAKIVYFDQNKTRAYIPYSIFPINKPWNEDWYGPLRIPKKGDVVKINQETLPMYQWIIGQYEGHQLENKNGKIYIDGKEAQEYTIQQDYYFMMGDNRDASLDARFFGFVPEENIVGKPMFTWLSVEGLFPDSQASFQANGKTIRWDRMFKATNTGEKNKTSYWWIAAIILVVFFGWDFWVKLFKKKQEDE